MLLSRTVTSRLAGTSLMSPQNSSSGSAESAMVWERRRTARIQAMSSLVLNGLGR